MRMQFVLRWMVKKISLKSSHSICVLFIYCWRSLSEMSFCRSTESNVNFAVGKAVINFQFLLVTRRQLNVDIW